MISLSPGWSLDKSAEIAPTLLHFCAWYGLHKLCEAVLELPVTREGLGVKNHHGQTPLELAQKQGHHAVVQYLTEFAAEVSSIFSV